MAENRFGKWRNTLCRSEIDPGHGKTHSADRKSTQDEVEHTLLTLKLTRDAAEHTLPTGNRPGTWRNTLCRPEINRDLVEHTLATGYRFGKWRNRLCRPEIDPGHGGTHSANRKSTQDVAEHTLPTGNGLVFPTQRKLCTGYTSAGRLRPAIFY